jgi:hypothetical protein
VGSFAHIKVKSNDDMSARLFFKCLIYQARGIRDNRIRGYGSSGNKKGK